LLLLLVGRSTDTFAEAVISAWPSLADPESSGRLFGLMSENIPATTTLSFGLN
jgi:hypothetical protein